jgi:hypothetical protein
MKNTDTSQLPKNIERQLSELELRHKRHKQMLDEHHDRKHDRRVAHRARHFTRSVPPICLV